MKKLVLLFCIAAVGFISCEKEEMPKSEVPSEVLNVFESEFPSAVDVEWEKKGSDYQVDFEIDNIDFSALISSAGAIQKVKYDILSSELPEEVKTAISTNYPDKILDDADVLEINGETYYQIEFDGGIRDTHVIFDVSGNENSKIEYWD